MEREDARDTKQRDFVGICKELHNNKEAVTQSETTISPLQKKSRRKPSAIMWYTQISRLTKLHTRVETSSQANTIYTVDTQRSTHTFPRQKYSSGTCS
eukprot:11145940-Heterocapsa_arctica.AAC.1